MKQFGEFEGKMLLAHHVSALRMVLEGVQRAVPPLLTLFPCQARFSTGHYGFCRAACVAAPS